MQVYAVPKRRGTYTAWLVVTDLGGTAARRGLGAEYDSVVLKEWTFLVSEVSSLATIRLADNPLVHTTL